MAAEDLVLEVLGGVPPKFRDGFKFSAKNVFGDEKYQADWSMTDRIELLQSMMSIPRRIGMAVSLGVKWRGATDFSEAHKGLGLTPSESDHLMAFITCLAVADRNIRKHAGHREVATVVAEDHPTMKKHLRHIPREMRKHPIILGPDHLRKTETDLKAGYLTQKGDFRVERIRNSVHFVAKEEDPLVQVADACAYGFRRFFNSEKFGLEFVRSILETESHLKDFASPGGASCFWPNHLTFR
jgi:hypothetical protein